MSSNSFQLKGSLFTLSVLQLQNADLVQLKRELSEKIQLAPKFFEWAPVVLDFNKLSDLPSAFDFQELMQLIREHRLIPVGVRGLAEGFQAQAQQAGLATLTDSSVVQSAQAPSAKSSEAVAITPQKGARLITQPIRSGQQIYAQGGDLVVVSSVSPGAELLADGNIHVYGTLRGRALAGINGDETARIFCQKLEAELVSIAGHYKVFEEVEMLQHPGPVQLYLDQGQLIIASF